VKECSVILWRIYRIAVLINNNGEDVMGESPFGWMRGVCPWVGRGRPTCDGYQRCWGYVVALRHNYCCVRTLPWP